MLFDCDVNNGTINGHHDGTNSGRRVSLVASKDKLDFTEKIRLNLRFNAAYFSKSTLPLRNVSA